MSEQSTSQQQIDVKEANEPYTVNTLIDTNEVLSETMAVLSTTHKQTEPRDMYKQYNFDTTDVNDGIIDICKQFFVSNERLKTLTTSIDKSIKDGLGRETNQSSVVKCYVTYVHDLPNGSERGRFLALDLGGTNFRVLLIELCKKKSYNMQSEIYTISEEIQNSKGSLLFDHIAKCLAEFIRKYKEKLRGLTVIPLGFTFSFPLRQEGLTKGYLKNWTKGFNCSEVVDRDVVMLLREAIDRRNDINVKIYGIINDTTGAMIACAWMNLNTKIGLIVGTGCNACYEEEIKNVELFDGDQSKQHVIINTEWGAFGDQGMLDDIFTVYDNVVDYSSLNIGRQRFEKLISGMYLGEIVRQVIIKAMQENLMFHETQVQMIIPGKLETSYLSDIEMDDDSYGKTMEIMRNIKIVNPSLIDCANVRYICESVSKRSAYLVSAGLAALLNKIDSKIAAIGVDGSLYRYHPYFKIHLKKMTRVLTKPDIEFELIISKDGSGRGAAILAAAAVRKQLEEDAME